MNGSSGFVSSCLLVVLCLVSTVSGVRAGTVQLSDGAAGSGYYSIGVTSFAERRFKTILKQQYDFSCGSAALATLLAFHYEDTVGELEVFGDMWDHGDQERIQKQGFSLLDMKLYLERRGYKADGFKIGLEELAAKKVPAITIINNKGYLHFVVIKGLEESSVLLGDPALGLKRVDLQEFEAAWNNRILFVIRSKKNIASRYFNSVDEWSLTPKAPLGMGVDNGSLATFNLMRPGRYDF